mgnify:CR=1 FL=1
MSAIVSRLFFARRGTRYGLNAAVMILLFLGMAAIVWQAA